MHRGEYVAQIAWLAGSGGGLLDGVETGANPHTPRAAARACGAVVAAVEECLSGTTDRAFCAIRPPGHHALPHRAMGFCIYNNIAVGTQHALSRGIEKVLIIDFDYHHGNGTEHIFWTSPNVFYFSIHCSPAWPMTGARIDVGEGAGKGTTVNCPLSPGAGRDEYLRAIDESLSPALKAFEPGLVMFSAGFDAHRNDTMVPARMGLRTEDFRTITAACLSAVESRWSRKPAIGVLEGGYNVDVLGACAEQHLWALIES